MKKKIITIPFSINTGAAANVSVTVSKKLDAVSGFKKCRGFGIALNSNGGVPVNGSLEPVSGRPLIDPVSLIFLQVDSQVRPDERLHTIEFDVTNQEVNVVITPTVNTTSPITGQAIFLLTED